MESRYASKEEFVESVRQKTRKKYEHMSKEEMIEFNRNLLNESKKVLDPRREYLEMHPAELKTALSATKRYIDKESLVELLWKTGGNMSAAATILHVRPATLKNWLTADGNLHVLEEINESWTDMAESIVNKHIIEGESLDAAKFRLKTKGKGRGYFEKQEHEIHQTIKVKLEADAPPDTLQTQNAEGTVISDEEFEKGSHNKKPPLLETPYEDESNTDVTQKGDNG